MLKYFNYKIGQIYLLSKILMRVVPLRLYFKLCYNMYKNSTGRHSPFSAILGLTYKCQCKCVHCSAGLYKQDINNEMSAKQWRKVLDDIGALGVPRVNISGGEALLRQDIFDIIKYAAKKFVVILESNGQLLTEETVGKLKKTRVSCVAVSVDSYDASVHDNLRGLKGCFRDAVNGVSILVKHNIPCILSTYITSERANSENIVNMMKLAKRLKVLAVRVMPARPVGSFSCHVSSLLSDGEVQKILKLTNPYLAYFNGIPAPKQCGIFTKSVFYISPYGEIQPCPFMPLSFGNVKNSELKYLLANMWNHKIFDTVYRDCLVLNKKFREQNLSFNNPHQNINDMFPIKVM